MIKDKNNTYNNLFDKNVEYYSNTREDIIQFIPLGIKKTLEFGCGQGDFSLLVKNKFKTESWAVELHSESGDIASQKLDKVICGDAIESIDKLPDNYFDVIIFLDILEHLNDPYTLLNRCKCKLSENGVVIASIPNIRYYSAFKSYLFNAKWEYKQHGIMDIGHLRFFTHSSIIDLFESLDYTIKTIKGMHPTKSNSYKLLNLLMLNRLWDVRYKHFIIVAEKGKQ